MTHRYHKSLSILLVPITVLLLAVPSDLKAREHVSSPGDLRTELRDSAAVRQQHVSKLQQFLSTSQSQKMLEALHVDPAQAQQAVSRLSDAELARLAAQVERTEFSGSGLALTNQQVTIILVGIILIIVVAIVASR
jgi:hypothetical protein